MDRMAPTSLLTSLSLVLLTGLQLAEGGGGAATTQMALIPKCTSISAVAPSSARAADPSTNQGIQFAVPPAPMNKPLVGQTVCLYQGTRGGTSPSAPSTAAGAVNRAVFVGWPAEAHRKDTVSVGYMESWVKLSNTGRIDGTTRTWTNNNAQGFTGGVKVQLQDRNGNVLQWNMPVQTYGVNANNPASQMSAPSDRKVDWYFPVPTAVLNQLARVRIIHRHTPEGRWDQTIEMAKELGEVLKTYSEVYATVKGAGG